VVLRGAAITQSGNGVISSLREQLSSTSMSWVENGFTHGA
jgi:hypothetical protein